MLNTLRNTAAVALIAFLGALTGCAPLQTANPEELRVAETADLCYAYHRQPREAIREALNNRTAIRPDYWPTIDAKKIRIGMSENELMCSWGRPDRINKSVSASSARKQFVYQNRQYVYTVNGLVTSWQN